MIRPPPRSTLFPYPTLFRSRVQHGAEADQDVRAEARGLPAELALQTDRAAEDGAERELGHQLQPQHVHDLLQELLHQSVAPSSRPMRRRTSSIVSRASARAFSAPRRRVACTRAGSACSLTARSRMGASAAIILSASTRLQSRQPQAAVRQFVATCCWVSGGENPSWMVKMLQMSGLPGSLRVTRAGSVAAGLSFSQMSSGGSSSPMVLPRLFDIFAWPSSPSTRFAVVSCACGSGKNPAP